MKNKIAYFEGDLPSGAKFGGDVAVDCEFTGLSLSRDRLCLAQVEDGAGNIYVVRLAPPYDCPNIERLLADSKICKIFHFARADLGMIKKCLGVDVANVFCTKIASRLVRTYTDKHSLKALVKEFFGVDLDKDEQTSDWSGKPSEKQIEYAANDVAYLHELKKILSEMLKREKRVELAEACFGFLNARVALDLAGWDDEDIFAH
ncbi:MAG: ribonuclease D [Rickettsiales bacterium]|jgi:ribonuclease D|nr:ribonuclease D [Rickettsiales bacterium]